MENEPTREEEARTEEPTTREEMAEESFGLPYFKILFKVHIRAYTTIICRKLENRQSRLDTKRIRIRLQYIDILSDGKVVSGDQREAQNLFLWLGVQTVTHQ